MVSFIRQLLNYTLLFLLTVVLILQEAFLGLIALTRTLSRQFKKKAAPLNTVNRATKRV